jgi:hypothetical protein
MSNATGARNHPHPSLLPEYREKGPEEHSDFSPANRSSHDDDLIAPIENIVTTPQRRSLISQVIGFAAVTDQVRAESQCQLTRRTSQSAARIIEFGGQAKADITDAGTPAKGSNPFRFFCEKEFRITT